MIASLYFYTGKCVLSWFFKEVFPFGGGVYHPNLILFDKFFPENYIRAIHYFCILAKINPYCIKFGDKKSLKGRVVFNWKVQQNPLTGEIPLVNINSDFANTYSLMDFMGSL